MTIAVIGGGIIGLAVARQLLIERPGADVVVLEKESAIATHQTGHNSGVVHAGIYYKPGSRKAWLCVRGRQLLLEFCQEHAVPIDPVGKLVVALDPHEKRGLAEILRRAHENGVTNAVMLDGAGLREIEPHVSGISAIHSPSTSIVDFVRVSQSIADDICARGGRVQLHSEVVTIRSDKGNVVLGLPQDEVRADRVIACGGLQSARLARLLGADPDPKIIPFRGEYYQLSSQAAAKVRGLVYPVPDPRYPFLGIHLTRRIDGTVDVGPNAVLAMALEGYRRRDLSTRDLAEMVGWSGFRAMAHQHWRTGIREMRGSLSRRYFATQARKYLPSIGTNDLIPKGAGVRAQAIGRDGTLVDDFVIEHAGAVTLVRNAPSPAATSSLAIAQYICADVALKGGS